MVILCGSLISMMESQTLAYNSPLYGRRTAQIRLGQISFRHYWEFFPGRSRKELMEMYAITGGVPKYIEMFAESKDIYRAIAAGSHKLAAISSAISAFGSPSSIPT